MFEVAAVYCGVFFMFGFAMHLRSWLYAMISFFVIIIAIIVFNHNVMPMEKNIGCIDVFCLKKYLKLFIRIFISNVFISTVFFVIGFHKKGIVAISFAVWNIVVIVAAFSKAFGYILQFSSFSKFVYCIYAFCEILCYSYSYNLGKNKRRGSLIILPVVLLVVAGAIEASLPWIIINMELR